MRHECYFCHFKTVEELIAKFKPEREAADLFAHVACQMLIENRDKENVFLSTDIHRLAKRFIHCSNLYKEEKFKANKILLESYDYWQRLVKESSNPLFKAAQLAVVGNIIDYGAHTVSDDIENQINYLLNSKLAIDESKELFSRIKESDSILYIGDNAGEIVFDKLFIETIQHPNITYAVRGQPVINDITYEDARQTGLNKICKVMSNGYDAPATILSFCSEEFIHVFKKADLIISKGQGNFEGLMNSEHENIFFMLIAKCLPIAELLGVDKGSMVIAKLKMNKDAMYKSTKAIRKGARRKLKMVENN